MGSERRNCARRILYSPEYLDMGADNGGVVVDLSEGGLRFQAVGRIEPDSDVALSFSLGSGYRIDVEGHVVWVNPRGNSGGIAFKKLSGDSRSLIREWLSKPESEHLAEAGVSTAESEEENDSSPAALQAPLGEAAAGEATVAGPAIHGQPLETEALNGPMREARVDEIPAPDVLAFGQRPLVPGAAPVPPSRAVRPAASSRPSASEPPPAAPRSGMKQAGVNNARPAGPTSIPPGAAAAPVAPSFARPAGVPPQRPAERKQATGSGGSFSVAPSISAWSTNEAPPIPHRPNPLKTGAPLFPPRNADNIFARGPRAPQFEPETHRGRKAFFILVMFILIAGGVLFAGYEHGYRQQIGAIIERAGSIVAGESGATGIAPSAAKPVNQPSHAAASQPPAHRAVAGAPSHPKPLAPPPAHSSNSAPMQANPSVAAAGKSLAGQTPQPGSAKGRPAHPPAATPAQTPVALTTQPAQSASQQAAKNPAASAPASPANLQSGARAEYLRAQQYLYGSGIARDPAEAAEWFWRSLEAGDTDAALPLADLYLKGQGVSQSCVQARILLDAAVRKGNAEAARKLGQLPENCQ